MTSTQKKKQQLKINFAKAMDICQTFYETNAFFSNWVRENYTDENKYNSFVNFVRLINDYDDVNIKNKDIVDLLDSFFNNKRESESNINSDEDLVKFIDSLPYGHWIDNQIWSLEDLGNSEKYHYLKKKVSLKEYELIYNGDLYCHYGYEDDFSCELRNHARIKLKNKLYVWYQTYFDGSAICDDPENDEWLDINELKNEYNTTIRRQTINNIINSQ